MSKKSQTERPSYDTTRSSDEVHINVKTEGTIGLPHELLKYAFGEISQIVRCLFDSLRLDLRPCADGDVTTGTDNLVCRFSFAPFDYRFQGSPTFPTSDGNATFTTHSSSPVDNQKQPTPDSTSEAGNESVAQDTKTLSEQARDELLRSDIRRAIERERHNKIASDEMEEENVAPSAFDLSVEELLQIIKGFPADALKERALNELKRRCGEGEVVR